MLAASVVLVVGGTGVTAARNAPLNERLATPDLAAASPAELAAARAAHEVPWNRWNAVRTVACTLAVGLVLVA